MPRRLSLNVTGLISIGVLVAAILGAFYFYLPSPNHPIAIEGRPLLEQDGPLFTDEQISLQFRPPPKWGMQARSTESPTTHKQERMVVKYKRLIRGPRVAWLRVSIGDINENSTPAELLRSRKPREANWTVTKDVEDGLTVGGRPAARITFGGLMNPDTSGSRQCSTEMVAVHCGKHAIYFAGTFMSNDEQARNEIRAAVESAVFERKKFAKQ